MKIGYGYIMSAAFCATMAALSGQPWWLAGTAVAGAAGWLRRRRDG